MQLEFMIHLGIQIIIVDMSTFQDKGISLDSRSMRRSRLNSKQNSNRYEESSMASEENEFIKAYNYSPQGNRSFAYPEPKNTSYNTINVSKMSERESLSPIKKKSLVEELTQRNDMLQKEVTRVQRILNMGDNRKSKKLPEIVDGNLIKKQLENAYKQIKNYEVDITHREKLYEHEGTYVQKIRKAEKTLSERQQMVKKLQAEISEIKKQSNEYVKLLTDGHIKKEYANKTSRLHKEIKFYETQIKAEEDLEMSDYYNNEQKNQRIFEMEQKLINSGFDKGQIFSMKKQFESKEKTIRSVSRVTNNEVSEDRSKKAFQSLKGEILTFKKMQKGYSKKIEELQNQKEEAEMRAMESKLRLQTTEREILKMEEDFAYMKTNIDPNKLKPSIKQGGSFTQSSVTQFKGKGNPLDHYFDVVQIGENNKKATPFNDRLIIGRKSAYIVQLTFYENRSQFLGFQAVYQMGDTLKKGGLNLLKRENERFLKDKRVKLEPGDFFKYFECAISKTNIITGFIAVSMNGKSIQAGVFDTFKKQLELKNREYPCCLYGCYSFEGFEMMGIEKVEPE